MIMHVNGHLEVVKLILQSQGTGQDTDTGDRKYVLLLLTEILSMLNCKL